jgi:AcrR family transcriptional regulator
MARPRSVRAHDQVLEAAIQLFAERGIDATSIDAIAETSRVSKATIYKHWVDKDALALEALARAHAMDERLSQDTGDPRADIIALLGRGATQSRKDLRNKLMPHLMSYAVRNPEFARAWKARTFEPTKARLKELLESAVEQGQFPADLNLHMAVAMLLGPMMYFTLNQIKTPDDMIERVVDGFWKAHSLGYAPRARPSGEADPRYPRSYRPADSTSAPYLGSRSRRGD